MVKNSDVMRRVNKGIFVLPVIVAIFILYQVFHFHHRDLPLRPISNDLQIRLVVQKIRQLNKPILVTVINDAYMPFAHSWLCNTMYMDIHQQVLVIATDEKSRVQIATTWPNIQVVAADGDGFHGNQDYSHAGYVRIMVKRTELILKILQEKIEVLLFDLDTFWRTDPIPFVMQEVKGHDIAAVPVANRKGVVCGGFIFMKPTESMVKLWRELTDMMLRLEERIKSYSDTKPISEGDNDQAYISRLLNEKFANIKLKYLTLNDFPDGQWYKLTQEHRNGLSPLVIHNNWIVGNSAKIKRAKDFKQWFWDSNTEKCDADLVILQTISSN